MRLDHMMAIANAAGNNVECWEIFKNTFTPARIKAMLAIINAAKRACEKPSVIEALDVLEEMP